MIKRFFSVLGAGILLLIFLSFPVFAHPGKTDSNGGHRDRASGEYHYHHGYEAHAHYDVDNDGIVDCPFDFDDQTGIHSGSYSIDIPDFDFPDFTEPVTEPPTAPEWYQESIAASNSSESSSPPSDFMVIFGVLASIFSVYYLPYSLYSKYKRKASVASPPHSSAIAQPNTTTDIPVITKPTPEHHTCHLIWLSTYHISRHLGYTYRILDHGFIWAAMFYIVAKCIRNQDTVDCIYSHFSTASTGICEPNPYAPDSYRLVRINYRSFAPTLNRSGIDPRTEEGRHALWILLCQQISVNNPTPDAYKTYQEYADILIADASKYDP